MSSPSRTNPILQTLNPVPAEDAVPIQFVPILIMIRSALRYDAYVRGAQIFILATAILDGMVLYEST